MKVLQINCVYHEGSTGKIVRDLHHHLLRQGIESMVCYGRGKPVKEPGVVKICSEIYAKFNNLLSRLRGTMYGGCCWSTLRLIRRIQKEKPDVVHLHSINGYFVNVYRLVAWLKAHRIKTVLTLHAEFLYTANCGHGLDCEKWKTGCGNCPRLRQETHSWFRDGTASSFRKLRASFQGFENDAVVVSVSDWLSRRAQQSLILGSVPHRTIFNGVDTGIFSYRPGEKAPGEMRIFHATAMFSDDSEHLKGGWYLLELAKRLQDLPVRFLVAGKHKISGKLPKNVTLLGEITDRGRLAQYYCDADLTVLTSKRETFSMVCGESLCCGTPVVGFRAGAPEEICLPAYSRFIPWGDLDALETAVRSCLKQQWDKEKISTAAVRRYAMEAMLQEYTALYREMVNDAQ